MCGYNWNIRCSHYISVYKKRVQHLLSFCTARADKLSKIRSDSALPHPQPDSCPPTPTRLAGTGTVFEFEDRGDLISFYNTVFVKRVKNFATKFSAQNTKEGVSSGQCYNLHILVNVTILGIGQDEM